MKQQHIEEMSLNAWPATQQVLLDGWVLRFAEGYTKRANSVNLLYPSQEAPLPKIDYCESFYRERGLPTVFRLTSFSDSDPIDQLLAEKHYTYRDKTLVQLATVSEATGAPSPYFQIWNERFDLWLDLFHQYLGTTHSSHLHRRLLETIPFTKVPFVLNYEGDVVACGLGVVDGPYLGIFDVVTAPQHRRKGYGKQSVASLLAWAYQNAVKYAYLQVVENNLPAIQLYQRFGFETAYHYWYRTKD